MFDSVTFFGAEAASLPGVDDDPWLVVRLPDDRPERLVDDVEDWWASSDDGLRSPPRRPGLPLGAWLEDSRGNARFPAPEVDAESAAVRDAEREAGDRVVGWRRMRGWSQAEEMREIAAMADRAVGRAEATRSVVLDAEAAMASMCAELALMWRVAPRTAPPGSPRR